MSHNKARRTVGNWIPTISVGLTLGKSDVKSYYTRTRVGALWKVLGIALQVGIVGFVLSFAFSADASVYVPYLALSIVLWTTISQSLTEACQAFISNAHLIKHLPLPLGSYIVALLWRQSHNLIYSSSFVMVVFWFFGQQITYSILFLPLGILLLFANLTWAASMVALLNSRFRDIADVVQTSLTLLFYATPLIWMPGSLPQEIESPLLFANPLFHITDIIRRPLTGDPPAIESLAVAATVAFTGLLFSWLLFRKYRHRISYWV